MNGPLGVAGVVFGLTASPSATTAAWPRDTHNHRHPVAETFVLGPWIGDRRPASTGARAARPAGRSRGDGPVSPVDLFGLLRRRRFATSGWPPG